jgi:hypothetical protein
MKKNLLHEFGEEKNENVFNINFQNELYLSADVWNETTKIYIVKLENFYA